MLVQEMHVQFDSRLQRMNSNAFDIFYPAEKDILLNYAQNKFIRVTLPPNENNKKVEGSQKATKRYDDLQTLVTKKSQKMYILEDNVLFSVLPYDFFDFITANTSLKENCNGVTTTSSTANLYIAYLPFVDDVATTSLYSDFKWTLTYNDGSSLILAQLSDYPKFPTLSANDEKFLISNFAIYENNRKSNNVKVYWEKYGDIYKPNNFIFVSSADNLNKIVMNVKGALSAETSFASLNYSYYSTITGTLAKKETRLVPTQFVQSFIANPFQSTGSDSPITELTDNRILLHHNSKFATDHIEIVYYRKPKLINYYLDVSCELHEARHDKIIDIAVEAASAFIGNPREVKTLTNFINQSNE
tara:strand:- start:9940 stop:11016 length:1077 start_codon:yes stop_codon:yes gene_type:complete